MDSTDVLYKLVVAIPASISFIFLIYTLSRIFLYSASGSALRQTFSKNKNCCRPIPVDWKIVALLCADLLQATSGQISYFWLYLDISNRDNQYLCASQGLLLCIADLASAFCSTYICYALLIAIFGSAKGRLNARSWVQFFHLALCYIFPIGLTVAVFFLEPIDPKALAFEGFLFLFFKKVR